MCLLFWIPIHYFHHEIKSHLTLSHHYSFYFHQSLGFKYSIKMYRFKLHFKLRALIVRKDNG